MELTQLDALAVQLDKVEKRLAVIAKGNPQITRLMTIPGVGPRTAEVLVATIDDPHRFKNARQVSSYIGMIPKQYQSGETDRNGRITKRGSRLLRTMLVECAWISIRYNAWAKITYARLHGGQKTRRKKAGIALARKIAVIAWGMMRDETDWDPSKLLPELQPGDPAKIKVTQKPNVPAGAILAQQSKSSIDRGNSRSRKGARKLASPK